MSEARVNRRLAAILAADVAGYSRLMGDDEVGTLSALQTHRAQLIEPAIAEHGGRVVKTTGDGLLAEFASAVEAMKCAIKVQRGMSERNSGVAQGREMLLRIGINVGDVIVDGGDLYGDGVNIAARLENLAEPGAIYISRTAYDQVRDKLSARFDDLGEQLVKNIARPVQVFRVAPADLAAHAAQTTGSQGSAPPVPDRPSIVVLAFENMSGDRDQEYFSDGIAEDIITDLSKISGLFVIARNSAFAYKGKSIDLRSLSRELGVRYVLEGSVRKSGNRIRVTAQLIDGPSGGHLWGERYDRDLTDIFAVQDELTREIVGALSIKLTTSERRRLNRHPTTHLDAYDHFLRGRENFWLHSRASVAEARAQLETAIELDPAFSAARAYLAFVHHIESINGWSPSPDRALETAHALAQKAVELDGGEPVARCALASTYLWRREHDRALVEAEAAVAVDPNFAQGYQILGWVHHYSGRSKEALAHLRTAMRLDPHYPGIYLHFVAQAHFQLGEYEQAAAAAQRRLARNPYTDITRVLLAACYGYLGQPDKARAEWCEALRINPDYSLEHRRRSLPYKNADDAERIVEGLRKAGLPV